MSVPTEELEVKISTENAQSFIEWFYSFVSDRKSLAAFYVNANTKYAAANTVADISINGLVCPTPADFEALLETQATGRSSASSTAINGNGAVKPPPTGSAASTPASQRVRYEVEGFDVQVLNPHFRLACPDQLLQQLQNNSSSSTGGGRGNTQYQQQQLQHRMASLLVQVTGHVVYGGGKDAAKGPFTEVFVLVPNWDVLVAGSRAPRNMRSYLILSQNFRAL